MTNLTTLEKTVLHEITLDDFYEEGLNSAIWADSFVAYGSIPSKEVRGVLSSLIKKNIIKPIAKGRDAVIMFTEHGKQIMRELGYEG